MTEPEQLDLTGLYYRHGPEAVETEREAGEAVEAGRKGPMKPNKPEHRILHVFGNGYTLTAYDASYTASGDWHRYRRETRRLYMRGFLELDGTLPNRAPGGRPRVEAWRITDAGRAELARLGTPE